MPPNSHPKYVVCSKNTMKASEKTTSLANRFLIVWQALKSMVKCVWCYVMFLWQRNPFAVLSARQRRLYFVENYGEVMIKPKMKERILDLFLTDKRRRKRLMKWVHSRIIHQSVFDFSSCWQDGIALCALLESICPGICPSYHLLTPHHRVKNCRLGLKLAHKYLYVPMDLLTPEELAIANSSTEYKIIQYLFMLKWASENIKDKWSVLHESLIAAKTGKCFVKGSGLRNGIVGGRSKFTVLVSDTIGIFNLLIEIRGPNSEFCGERIVSLHQAKGMLDKAFTQQHDVGETAGAPIKYLEDGVGGTFLRRTVPPKYGNEPIGDVMQLDVQCGEEGTFYVTYIPRRAGMHTVSIKWQNHHVESSPFRVKVYKALNVTAKGLKDAREKRVIYDSLSFGTGQGSSHDGSLSGPQDEMADTNGQQNGFQSRHNYAIAKSKAFTKGRQLTVTRRRVLRRIITRNGEDIVIEETVSPSMSRQSSLNSDEELKSQFKEDRKLVSSQQKALPNGGANKSSGNTLEESVWEGQTSLGTVIEEKISPTETNRSDSNTFGSQRCDGNTHSQSVPTETKKGSSESGSVAKTNPQQSKYKDIHLDNSLSRKRKGKKSVRRTKSDTPIYLLRKRLVSLTSDSEEEEDTAFSSNGTLEDASDTSTPALKLLHSSSLRKACLYISQKAISGTQEDSVESVSKVSTESKLGMTKPLPIVRRMWPPLDAPENHESKISKMENGASLNYSHTCSGTGIISFSSNRKDEQTKQAMQTQSEEDVIIDSEKLTQQQKTDDDFNSMSVFSDGFVVKTYQTVSNPERAESKDEIQRHKTTLSTNISTCDNKQSHPVNMKGPCRGSLKRQNSIHTAKSSGESSPESSKAGSAVQNCEQTTRSKDSFSAPIAFRSISNSGRDADDKPSFTSEVHIVIPKPKVDKSIQVSEAEIKEATGWNLYEGLYVLLRRITLKVPTVFLNGDPCGASGLSGNISYPFKDQRAKLTLPDVKVKVAEDFAPFQNESTSKHDSSHYNVQINPVENVDLDLRDINAWIERNRALIEDYDPHRLAPIRQLTIDTVDSGFTDDSPSRLSRQGRFSLPILRTPNGHVPLFRRPYRGKISLDPRLVQSADADVMSAADQRAASYVGVDDRDLLLQVDYQALGNLNESVEIPTRTNWRANVEDTFSLSDSELNSRNSKKKSAERRRHSYASKMERRSCSRQSKESDGCGAKKFHGKRRQKSKNYKRFRHMRSDVRMASFESTDDDVISGNTNRLARMNQLSRESSRSHKRPLRKNIKGKIQGTSSSLEECYYGFGIAKPDRTDLLGAVEIFSNLYSSDADELQRRTSDTVFGEKWQKHLKSDDYGARDSVSSFSSTEHNRELKKAAFWRRSDSSTVDGVFMSMEEEDEYDDEQSVFRSETQESDHISFEDFLCQYQPDGNDVVADRNEGQSRNDASLKVIPGDTNTVTNCEVGGAGISCGLVGVKNSFQVWTDGTETGSLNVNITGPKPHSVAETSVLYTGDNLYEVSYEVTLPGRYIIDIRFAEKMLPQCPFIAKITF